MRRDIVEEIVRYFLKQRDWDLTDLVQYALDQRPAWFEELSTNSQMLALIEALGRARYST